MAKWLTCGCVALLTLMVGFHFVRFELEKYDREHMSPEEAIDYGNSLGDGELDRIYAAYQRQCERKGITSTEILQGKEC